MLRNLLAENPCSFSAVTLLIFCLIYSVRLRSAKSTVCFFASSNKAMELTETVHRPALDGGVALTSGERCVGYYTSLLAPM